MAEYISREAAIDRLEKLMQLQAQTARAIIEAIPAADVAPIRHGRWVMQEEKSDGLVFRVGVCSFCGHTKPMKIFGREDYAFNYCPNCGAQMEAGNEN